MQFHVLLGLYWKSSESGERLKTPQRDPRMQVVGLTWALLEGYQGESELAEMVSEVVQRRGHCWQTQVQAGMGWGVLRRRMWPPQAQESEGAPVWDPAPQVAGLVDVHWTQVGAVEWGCGGREGFNLENGYCEHPPETEVGVEAHIAGAPEYLTANLQGAGVQTVLGLLMHLQLSVLPELSPGPHVSPLCLCISSCPVPHWIWGPQSTRSGFFLFLREGSTGSWSLSGSTALAFP